MGISIVWFLLTMAHNTVMSIADLMGEQHIDIRYRVQSARVERHLRNWNSDSRGLIKYISVHICRNRTPKNNLSEKIVY